MKNKLALYFPVKVFNNSLFNKGDYIEVCFIKNSKNCAYITKFNNLITIKKELKRNFRLKYGEVVKVVITKAICLNRPKKLFYKNRVDILSLIPEKTKRDSNIVVTEFSKGDEKWLRVWSCHSRGSCSQIELRRFISIDLFGRLLGQIQSEGSKTNFEALEFCNKSPLEHLDFINYLTYIGINRNAILAKFDYHPKIKNISTPIKEFQNTTGISVSYKCCSPTSKGGFGFHSFVRSVLFSAIILYALNRLRTELVNKRWDSNLKQFANGFLAKILNGDGTIEVITKNRNIPQARISIADGNFNYLKDYKVILKKFGFKPHICKNQGKIRSYMNYRLIQKLCSINAFHNNPNKAKLEFLRLAKTS